MGKPSIPSTCYPANNHIYRGETRFFAQYGIIIAEIYINEVIRTS